MGKTTLSFLFILVLVVFSCSKKEEPAPPPPPDVTVYQTQAQEVPIYQEFVGQLFGFKDIAIRARVEGFLEGIHFKEGSEIKKGASLYTLESQPFEADVAAKRAVLQAGLLLRRSTRLRAKPSNPSASYRQTTA